MLLALLAELGIDAEAVLVNSSGADDGLDQRLPIPQMFDHVLVRAHIDGAVYWLDGTLPPVASPSARPVFPVSWVLPLTARGSGIEKLAWQPATAPDEISLFEIDALAGFDKPARIVSTEIVRGVKGLQQQMQFSSVTSGQMLEAFRQRAIGDTWQAIDDVQWHYDQKTSASILTISGTGIVKWDYDGDGQRSLALPGGGFSPPERRAWAQDGNRDAPYYTKPEYTCHVTTVRLPSSTQARQWSSKPSFDTRIFGGTITVRGSFATGQYAWSADRVSSSRRLMRPPRSVTTAGSPRSTTAWAGSPTIPVAKRPPSAAERRCRPPMTSTGRPARCRAQVLQSPLNSDFTRIKQSYSPLHSNRPGLQSPE